MCVTDASGRGRNELDNLMISKRIGAYVGIDPTAASLHVGHLLPFMALYWMYLHGFHTVTLVSRSRTSRFEWTLTRCSWEVRQPKSAIPPVEQPPGNLSTVRNGLQTWSQCITS